MNHFEQQSYYDLLEVPVSATQEEILGAYERALETYSPDSIAVYTLVDPGQIDALRQRLTQARDVLCALEQRLEYDRTLGVTRSPEEWARLQAESLRRAAGGAVVAEEAPGSGPEVTQEEAPTEVLPQDLLEVVETVPVLATPAVEAAPVAETLLPEAVTPGVEASPVVEVAPVVEVTPEVARVPPPVPIVEAPPAPVASVTAALAAAAKPLIHARPTAPVGRHGAVPPPLPTRKVVRPPAGRPEGERPRTVSRTLSGQQLGEAPVLAQASAIATAESALAQVAMKVRDSRTRLKTIVDVPADAEFNGELLRKVREGRSVSLQLLAERTRISVRHVENIEADRYDVLPASVYLRGILMSIARELGLDPLRVSRSYMELVSSVAKKRR
ncbi:helix-turn-helix domain-containing protein [Melittangium boletus]|uniref:J domain-containing protein n=1 Tax=Melittangium boletus DSM 14713 TaxID=1294270 RepID=A0A250IMK9_9BACT|nr:helix-turn-helix domain-containing protein [Melittangium boletus]ATB32974.1 hypothetical protein MEBOL_006463 [Melittangium boletus DSM 14713]